MIVENDFAMTGDEAGPVDDRPRGGAAPVVVIPRRRGRAFGRFLPPALAILAAVAVLRYRVETPDWRGLLPGADLPPAAALEAVAQGDPIRPPTDSEPIVPALDAAPEPPEPPLAVPTAEVAARTVPRPEVPPDEPVATSKPADTDAAWDEIRREAERKKAELAEMKRLKREAPKQVKREQARELAEKLERVTALAASERPDFRANLKMTVLLLGDRAAPRIRSLASRYSHFVLPETEYRVAAALREISPLDREARVEAYRRHGVPEPIILNVLAQELSKDIVARNGPANDDDALVRAARQLLAVPLARSDQPGLPKAGPRARR